MSMDNFKELVKAIGVVLGPTSGLDSDEVDHNMLVALMERYQSDELEWTDYALADEQRNYTRNLVDNTNGKSNILVVVWNPGKGSPIHDHAGAHCIMKMLKGALHETIYEEPCQGAEAPRPVKSTIYGVEQVTYISDKIGLHKIENDSATETAVSLHLYTPPHAHNYGFNLFDEKTGKKCHITSAPLYSEHGRVCRDQSTSEKVYQRHNAQPRL